MSIKKRIANWLDPRPRIRRPKATIRTGWSSKGLIEIQGAAPRDSSHSYFEALTNNGERPEIPLYLVERFINRLHNRQILGAIARYLFDNNSYVGYAVKQIAKYSLPVIPQPATEDHEWNAIALDYWKRFVDVCDFHGDRDFYGLQDLICYAQDNEGDIGVVLREDPRNPLQLAVQLVHPNAIGARHDSKLTEKNPYATDGLIFDKYGRLQQYVIKTGDGKEEAIGRNKMMLVHESDDLRQFRGVSPMRRGANDIRDAKDLMRLEKIGVKFSSSIAAVLQTPSGEIDEDDWDDDEDPDDTEASDPTTPEETEKDAARRIALMDLIGGDIPVLPEGQELKDVSWNRPNSTFTGFHDALVGMFANGLEIPAAFFIDAKLTGPNQRAVAGKAQKKFNGRKATIAKVTKWIYTRHIAHGINTGQIPAHPQAYRVSFQYAPKASIDFGIESKQEREDLGAMLRSRRTIVGDRGGSWSEEINNIIQEDDYILEKINELRGKHPWMPLPALLKRYGFEIPKNNTPQNEPE